MGLPVGECETRLGVMVEGEVELLDEEFGKRRPSASRKEPAFMKTDDKSRGKVLDSTNRVTTKNERGVR